jgi:hypothetical protein
MSSLFQTFAKLDSSIAYRLGKRLSFGESMSKITLAVIVTKT